ncbi:hypothetical protein LTR51_002608 [Lithohypha guttulata]|nr:hypothetical protein LTR51_002608 [Lithohypha guttulata]
MVLHVKYPSMERQDLSQGQLGAFKFTPVDEVVNTSPQHQPHPLLLQQYSQSLQNAGYSDCIRSPDLLADPSFFNQIHNLTTLEDHRSSPRKRMGKKHQELMRAMAPPFCSQLQDSSENEPLLYASEMSGVPSDRGVQQSSNGNASLLRALEAEQDAHEATKIQLDHETNARQAAEAEVRRVTEHNKGLLNSIKLLQSTVKHMVQSEKASPKKHVKPSAMSQHESSAETAPNIIELGDDCGGRPSRPPSMHSDEAMPQIPASFLEKYGKKPEEERPEVVTPRKATLTVATAKEHLASSRVVQMADALPIDWKIDSRHNSELKGASSETKTQNYFRRHPVRYVPDLADKNLYRTVMMDFIPFGTSYADLLAQIRGGTLESVQMYGPIGNATDFVTARVVFVAETGAAALYMRGQHPGIYINGTQIRVWQVLEPTYPKNKELEEAIYVHGHTRILVINAVIENIEKVLKNKLRTQIEAGLVLDIGRTHDDLPIVEFTSIEEGTRALNALLNDRDFGGCDFDFEEDYVAAA